MIRKLKHTSEKFLNIISKKINEKRKYTINELNDVKYPGLYIIWLKDEIVYIGKTTRKLKQRLADLKNDYKSHTFLKKLIQQELIKQLNLKKSFILSEKKLNKLIADNHIDIKRFSPL